MAKWIAAICLQSADRLGGEGLKGKTETLVCCLVFDVVSRRSYFLSYEGVRQKMALIYSFFLDCQTAGFNFI